MENTIKETTRLLLQGVITKDEADKILLDLLVVINRRELLVFFNKEMSELHCWFLPAEDSMIDEFLSNQ